MECYHVRLNHYPEFFFFLKYFFIDYRHQDDETVASRGSISMKMAILREAERNRFEVHSIPTRSHHHHSGAQKWFMKANHPVEAHRWTQAIAKSIEWHKMREGAESDASSIGKGGSMMERSKSTRRKSTESDSSMMRTAPSTHSQSLSSFWKKSSSGNESTRDQDSMTGDVDSDASPDLLHNGGVVGFPPGPNSPQADRAGDDEEEDGGDTSSAAGSENKSPPHPNIDLQGNAIAAQLELTVQMLANISASTSAAVVPPSQFRETFSVLLDSLHTTQSLLSDYTSMAQSRDSWYARQLRKEKARQDVWEESLKVVVKEGEGLENELRKRSRNRGSRVFSGGSPDGTINSRVSEGKKRRPSALGFVTAPSELVSEPSPSPVSDGEPPPSAITPRVPSGPPITPQQRQEFPAAPVPAVRRMPPSRTATADTFVGTIPAITVDRDYDNFLAKSAMVEDDEHDTDEEDEFFDAIEANALPNMLVYEALTSPSSVKSPGEGGAAANILANQQDQQQLISTNVNKGPYVGYTCLRTSLKLCAERPNASLWSVLKHSIGKDLTKISFPVFFNEPTSMLQRMVSSFVSRLGGYADVFFSQRIWNFQSAVRFSSFDFRCMTFLTFC